MSKRLNATDVALARRLRALESANDLTIRATADLIATTLDASQAHRLPACEDHQTIVRMGNLMAEAIRLRGMSVAAHHHVVELGAGLGLPITSFGDICQMAATETPMSMVEQAA